jgi:ribosomal protein L15
MELHFTKLFTAEDNKRSKRKGRGPGSGRGKTCTRGTKGQKCRAGASIPARFEGGQMPVYRRTPKRGFNITEKNRMTFRISHSTFSQKTGLDSLDKQEITRIKKDLKVAHYYKKIRVFGNKRSESMAI